MPIFGDYFSSNKKKAPNDTNYVTAGREKALYTSWTHQTHLLAFQILII